MPSGMHLVSLFVSVSLPHPPPAFLCLFGGTTTSAGHTMASVISLPVLCIPVPFGGFSCSFATAPAASRLSPASAVRHCKSMRGYDVVMVGDRKKIWIPVYFHVMEEFTIMLPHENIVDPFFLPRVVENT